MRDYGMVYTRFWNNPDMRAVGDDGRLLALYLLSCPHSNSVGAYLCPDSFIADGLQWQPKRVTGALSKLDKIGFAKRFRDGRHIVVCNYLKFNRIQNENMGKAAIKIIATLPADDPAMEFVITGLELYRDKIGAEFETLRKRFTEGLQEPLGKGFGYSFRNTETETDPNPNPETNPDPGTETDRAPLRGEVIATSAFEVFWAAYPLKKDKIEAKKAYEAVLKKRLATEDELFTGAIAYAESVANTEPRFIKHAATWLGKGSWANDTTVNHRARTGMDSVMAGIGAILGAEDE